MNKVIITVLLTALLLGAAGCGEKNDENNNSEVSIIGGADGPTSIFLGTKTGESAISGIWQTASIGYENEEDIQPDDIKSGDIKPGDIQPEYYVQFTDAEIIYGHMKNEEFVPDHSDRISLFEESADGVCKVQAQTQNGVQYTYRTSENDVDILEYYGTWNEEEFSDNYSGSASLSRCK